MKRIIFIIIMLNSIFLFSQEQERIVSSLFSNAGGDFSWYFSKNYIEISTYSDETGLKQEKFPYSYENKGPYYNLLIHKKDKTEEYVTLMAPHKEFFLAYTNNKISPIEIGNSCIIDNITTAERPIVVNFDITVISIYQDSQDQYNYEVTFK